MYFRGYRFRHRYFFNSKNNALLFSHGCTRMKRGCVHSKRHQKPTMIESWPKGTGYLHDSNRLRLVSVTIRLIRIICVRFCFYLAEAMSAQSEIRWLQSFYIHIETPAPRATSPYRPMSVHSEILFTVLWRCAAILHGRY